MQATELIEHMLLPLAGPVPVADVTHPVSNGLPALIALMAKWRHDTPMVMSEHGVYLRERYLGMRTLAYPWPGDRLARPCPGPSRPATGRRRGAALAGCAVRSRPGAGHAVPPGL